MNTQITIHKCCADSWSLVKTKHDPTAELCIENITKNDAKCARPRFGDRGFREAFAFVGMISGGAGVQHCVHEVIQKACCFQPRCIHLRYESLDDELVMLLLRSAFWHGGVYVCACRVIDKGGLLGLGVPDPSCNNIFTTEELEKEQIDFDFKLDLGCNFAEPIQIIGPEFPVSLPVVQNLASLASLPTQKRKKKNRRRKHKT